jgi:hypothetical protein
LLLSCFLHQDVAIVGIFAIKSTLSRFYFFRLRSRLLIFWNSFFLFRFFILWYLDILNIQILHTLRLAIDSNIFLRAIYALRITLLQRLFFIDIRGFRYGRSLRRVLNCSNHRIINRWPNRTTQLNLSKNTSSAWRVL